MAVFTFPSISALASSNNYIESRLKKKNLSATLYMPTLEKQMTAVIVLGGSSGKLNENYSKILATNNIVALSMAYFKADGLPQSLDMVPIELVSSALDFLQSIPRVKKNDIGVLAISRGTELAFLSASIDERIKSVAAIVPSLVAWHGQTGLTAWTYQGQPIPSLTFDRRSKIPILERATLTLNEKTEVNRARFSFENINGRILLISAKQDHIWPSTHMADAIVDYLHKNDFPFSVNHLVVDDDHFFGKATQKSIYDRLVNHFSITKPEPPE
jgi:dienelactone hydrolase